VHGLNEGQSQLEDEILKTSVVSAAVTAKSGLNGVYEITPQNSEFRWVGKKVTGQHNGTILSRGKATFDNGQLSEGSFEIDMTTIKVTDIKDPESNADLTDHLHSADFFDVKTFPKAGFKISNSKMLNEQGVHKFVGSLTMKGKTTDVTGEYKLSEIDGAHMLEGGFTFDRAKHDVKFRSGAFFSDLGDKLIYDEVPVSFRVKL